MKKYKPRSVSCLRLAEYLSYDGEFVSLALGRERGEINLTRSSGKLFTHQEFAWTFAQLREFYKSHTLQEIEDFNIRQDGKNREYLASLETAQDRTPKARVSAGYIYLLHTEGEHYKIGLTQDVDRRVAQISPKLPVQPKVLHFIETADCFSTEAEIHIRFDSCRLNGEWFALTPKDVEWFCSIVNWETK